jgi:hypothetical protein
LRRLALGLKSRVDFGAIECLRPREPANSLAALLELVVGIRGVERIEILIVEADSIITDLEPGNRRQLFLEQALFPLDLDHDLAVSGRCAVAIEVSDCLYGINDRFKQRNQGLPFWQWGLADLILEICAQHWRIASWRRQLKVAANRAS